MTGETTVEVDPDELSEEVAKELVEEGNMSDEDIDALKDRVWFDEVHSERPNKSGVVASARSKIGGFKDYCAGFASSVGDFLGWVGGSVSDAFGYNFKSRWRQKTVFGTVSDVKRTQSDKLWISVEHSISGTQSFRIDANSTVLANLMDYHSVDNAMDLVGETVVFTSETLYKPPSYVSAFDKSAINQESDKLVVPNNTSFSGFLRFRIYSLLNDFRQRTRFRPSFWRGELYLLGLMGGFAVLVFPAILGHHFVFEDDSILMAVVGSVLLAPVLLGVLFYSLMFLYWGYWSFISFLTWLFRGSFFEVE